MITDYRKAHHRKPGYLDALEILQRLFELAGQGPRPGSHLEARKIRHSDRAAYLAWDAQGNRTAGAKPTRWTEYILGWANREGTFEGPPGLAAPATSWERALIPWAQALAAANPDLQEAQAGIAAIVRAAEAHRGQPHRSKTEKAAIWLQRLFAGTKRTEIPAAEILERSRAQGITAGTLARALRRAGFSHSQRWEESRNVHLWRRPGLQDPHGNEQE